MKREDLKEGMLVRIKSVQQLKKEYRDLTRVPGSFVPGMECFCGEIIEVPNPSEFGNIYFTKLKGAGISPEMVEPAQPTEGYSNFSYLFDEFLQSYSGGKR